LMQWAHGEIGDRTFRQLEEDFADLVIPRVWEQEKRKVSRAASRLSISPRKVRRVLGRLELLESDSHSDDEETKPTASVRERRRAPSKGTKEEGAGKSKPARRRGNLRAGGRRPGGSRSPKP
jgi:hypothetical protein